MLINFQVTMSQNSPSPQRGPGRPTGGPSKKRKADEDLSTNANTMRARKRTSRMTEGQLELEKAKGNMQRTITRNTRQMQASLKYTASDSETQLRLLQQVRLDVERR
jgi:hypothetical protein